jgi:uncharacterized damage-inducible protein DinB
MHKVPYADVLGAQDAVAVLAETPARLAAVLAKLTDEQLETPPAPGKWCVREVFAHLADCEIAWAWRLRQARASDRVTLQPFDQDAWAAHYATASLDEACAALFALRAWNVSFARSLTAEERANVYVHPERGEEPLATILTIMAGHDLHHLKALEAGC